MENKRLLTESEIEDIRQQDEASGERYIPDGQGNMVNERWQQIMESLENDYFKKYKQEPPEDYYDVIEENAQSLYDSGYSPEKPSMEEERALQMEWDNYYKAKKYDDMEKIYPKEAVDNKRRLDKEIEESLTVTPATPSANYTGKKYHIETKATKAPGMPGGRTWSIKQVYDE